MLQKKAMEAENIGMQKEAQGLIEEGISLLKNSKRDSVENTILIQLYQKRYLYLYETGTNVNEILSTALEVYHTPEIHRSDFSVYANLCSDIAHIYSMEGNKAATIRFYQKAIHEYKKSASPDYSTIGLSYNNLAYAYDEIGYTHQVLKNYEKAHAVWMRNCPTYIEYNNIVLQNLITTYLAYGDIKSAEKHLKTYQNYFVKYVNPAKKPLENLYQNDSVLQSAYDFLKANLEVALAKKEFSKAEDFLMKMKLLYKNTPAKMKEQYVGYVFACIENLASKYKNAKDYQQSEAVYKSTQPYINSDFSEMKFHASLGILYYDQKQYEKSLSEVNHALSLFPENTTSLSFYMLTVLKSELLMHLKKDEQSMQLQALLYRKMLSKEEGDFSLSRLTYKDFKQLNSSRHISILLKSALVFNIRYERTHQQKDILTAANFYRMAAEMFHQYYLKGFYNKDLEDYAREIKEGLLKTAILSGDKSVADLLDVIENNESQHLWKKFADRNSEALGLHENWLEEQQLSHIEDDFLSDSKSGKSKRATNETLKVKKKSAYTEFSTSDFSVKNIQSRFSSGHILVRYVVGEKQVYALVVSQKEVELFALSATEDVRKMVSDYYQLLKNIDKNHTTTGKELYQKLLFPLKLEHAQKLTFVMEDFMHLLPMESLLDYGSYSSVTSVNYTYSLRMLEIQANIKTQARGKKTAIFAPEYPEALSENGTDRKGGLKKLFFAQKEADAILQTTQGKLFAGADATKENFFQASSSYNVLHLAMHAIMDSNNYEQSYLAFQHQQPLYFSELYQMKIPSQLVILSACNTGKGLLENGEGFMSLSRAFTYAGVPATIHSLWEVPDKETADLMEIFYELLRGKHSPDEALFLAKKEFRLKYPQKSHPYFWAGFVMNGQVVSDTEKGMWKYWTGISIVVLIIPFLLIIMKRRKKSRASNF